MSDVKLEVWRDGLTGGLQVSIGDDNGGFRLMGPKFLGESELLSRRSLDDRDATEIRRWLDKMDEAHV